MNRQQQQQQQQQQRQPHGTDSALQRVYTSEELAFLISEKEARAVGPPPTRLAPLTLDQELDFRASGAMFAFETGLTRRCTAAAELEDRENRALYHSGAAIDADGYLTGAFDPVGSWAVLQRRRPRLTEEAVRASLPSLGPQPSVLRAAFAAGVAGVVAAVVEQRRGGGGGGGAVEGVQRQPRTPPPQRRRQQQQQPQLHPSVQALATLADAWFGGGGSDDVPNLCACADLAACGGSATAAADAAAAVAALPALHAARGRGVGSATHLAVLLYHHYYVAESFREADRFLVSAACLLIAYKSSGLLPAVLPPGTELNPGARRDRQGRRGGKSSPHGAAAAALLRTTRPTSVPTFDTVAAHVAATLPARFGRCGGGGEPSAQRATFKARLQSVELQVLRVLHFSLCVELPLQAAARLRPRLSAALLATPAFAAAAARDFGVAAAAAEEVSVGAAAVEVCVWHRSLQYVDEAYWQSTLPLRVSSPTLVCAAYAAAAGAAARQLFRDDADAVAGAVEAAVAAVAGECGGRGGGGGGNGGVCGEEEEEEEEVGESPLSASEEAALRCGSTVAVVLRTCAELRGLLEDAEAATPSVGFRKGVREGLAAAVKGRMEEAAAGGGRAGVGDGGVSRLNPLN